MFAGGARAGYGTGATVSNAALTLWESFSRLKYDAATLATEDLPDLDAIPAATKPILTLANVVKPDGTPFAPPVLYREETLADGRKVRIAVIGLAGRSPFDRTPVAPTATPASGTAAVPSGTAGAVQPAKPWVVKDPTETLRAVLPEARKKADLVVVLFAAMRAQARTLASEVPGVDVMVAGMEGAVDDKVEMVGPTALVQNADRGRYVVELGISLDKDRKPTAFDVKKVAMSEAVPDDPEFVPMVQEFRKKQALPVATPPRNPVPPANGANATTAAPTEPLVKSATIYAGSYACSGCHASEFKQWKASKHAIAMHTLENKDGGLPARRPDCVKCHVVGFEKPDGYTIQRPRWDLRDVGCESCHGPAAQHVQAMRQGKEGTSGITRGSSRDMCVTCHTPDNSPDFDYSKYLPHVVHDFKGKLPELHSKGMPGV